MTKCKRKCLCFCKRKRKVLSCLSLQGTREGSLVCCSETVLVTSDTSSETIYLLNEPTTKAIQHVHTQPRGLISHIWPRRLYQMCIRSGPPVYRAHRLYYKSQNASLRRWHINQDRQAPLSPPTNLFHLSTKIGAATHLMKTQRWVYRNLPTLTPRNADLSCSVIRRRSTLKWSLYVSKMNKMCRLTDEHLYLILRISSFLHQRGWSKLSFMHFFYSKVGLLTVTDSLKENY